MYKRQVVHQYIFRWYPSGIIDFTGFLKVPLAVIQETYNRLGLARKVNYAGWIPSENILMYDHAYINPRNNQPIRYRIGINLSLIHI